MTIHTPGSSGTRVGAWLGRVWLRYVRQEAHIARWMIGRGVSPLVTKAVLWTLKLVVFAALLYATFWLALLLLLVATVAWSARNLDSGSPSPQEEWRNGISGFGLYNQDGYRIDPHDIHDEERG